MASAIIPAILSTAGTAYGITRAVQNKKDKPSEPVKKEVTPSATMEQKPKEGNIQDAEAKVAAEQQAAAEKTSKQAAAFLKNRNAQGFGSNPNKARQFLLAL